MTFLRMAGLAAVCASMLAAPAGADDDWVTTTSADGVFHFASPLQPNSQTSRGDDGGVGFSQTVYTVVTDSLVIMTDEAIYDPGPHFVDPKLVLTGFLQGLKAELISSEDQPFTRGPGDVLPGLIAAARTDALTCHLRVVADGLKVFVMSACGRAGHDATADIDRAIASFAITK